MFKPNVFLPVCSVFLSVLACLNTNLPGQGNLFMQSHEQLKNGNRLLAIDLMRKALAQSPEMQGVMQQYLPLISDYEPTTPYSETKANRVSNDEYVQQLREQITDITRLNAIETIVQLARDRQIVILNEAHDSPQHRAFGQLLAMELKKIGFEFMAMETLAGPPGPVNIRYPRLGTGHYSAEPVFADFVRQAAKCGYQMIAYEIQQAQQSVDANANPLDSIKERENAQSDNLIEHVLDKHPDAKLFVYVGYSHATENWETLEDESQLGWMAAQINKKTGIDPLTIDQVGGSYNPKSSRVDSVFKLVQSQESLQQPTVLKLPSGTWLSSDSYYKKTDLTVFHPVQKMLSGRPDWLRMNGYRLPLAIENKDYFAGTTTLVQAYLRDERKGLPVDQLLLESDAGTSTFLLPAGEYRTEIWTIDGMVKQGPDLSIAGDQ